MYSTGFICIRRPHGIYMYYIMYTTGIVQFSSVQLYIHDSSRQLITFYSLTYTYSTDLCEPPPTAAADETAVNRPRGSISVGRRAAPRARRRLHSAICPGWSSSHGAGSGEGQSTAGARPPASASAATLASATRAPPGTCGSWSRARD